MLLTRAAPADGWWVSLKWANLTPLTSPHELLIFHHSLLRWGYTQRLFFWRRQVSSHSSSYNEAIPWRHCISQWRTSIMARRQNTWWSSHTENVVVDISQFHESSGYSSTLVASGVCTQGAADAILKVTNICHTWYIEQVSVMALQKLKQRAYAEKSHDTITPKQTTIQETVITEMVLMVAWLNCHKLRSSSSRNGSASMDLSLKISWWRGTFSCGRTIGVG